MQRVTKWDAIIQWTFINYCIHPQTPNLQWKVLPVKKIMPYESSSSHVYILLNRLFEKKYLFSVGQVQTNKITLISLNQCSCPIF